MALQSRPFLRSLPLLSLFPLLLVLLLSSFPLSSPSFVSPGACVLVGERDCYQTLKRLASGTGMPGTSNGGKLLFLDNNGQLARFLNGGDDGSVTLQKSGRVGIDVAKPTSKLHVNGDMRASRSTAFVAMDRRLMVPGSITAVNSTLQLAALRQLHVRDFRWRTAFATDMEVPVASVRRGLVSQEVEAHIPHGVVATPGTEVFDAASGSPLPVDQLKLVDYEAVVVNLVGSAQGLAIENDQLRARVTALEAAHAALLAQHNAQHASVTAQLNALNKLLSSSMAQEKADRTALQVNLDGTDNKHSADIGVLQDKLKYMSSVLFADGV